VGELIRGDDAGITISVVSHGQMALVRNLLDDLALHCAHVNFEVVLTSNIPEDTTFSDYMFPVVLLQNETPKGFGCNHNQAFQKAKGQYFCVVNPDIRLTSDPFEKLQPKLLTHSVGVCAPLVMSPQGEMEDSIRKFPSPLDILGKALGLKQPEHYAVCVDDDIHPDWVAGMFMLFSSDVFREINGFDERYFLYYEDVDVCARLTLVGKGVVVCPRVQVIHDAQRTSHRNLKYMRWHLSIMLRFFLSVNYWRLSWRS